MKVQLKSDMHAEINSYSTTKRISKEEWERAWYINPEAEALVLAGDIVPVCIEEEFEAIAERLLSLSIPVLYVPGNHEYWGSSIAKVNKILSDTFKGTNVHTVDFGPTVSKNSIIRMEVNDVTFLGTTMWTYLGAIQPKDGNWVDFKCIQEFTPKEYSDNSINSLQYLMIEAGKTHMRNKRVAVTHHAPYWKSSHEKYDGDPYNKFFHMPEHLIDTAQASSRFDLWMHGHMHNSSDYRTWQNLRVIANPMGHYHDGPFGNPEYKHDFIIEV